MPSSSASQPNSSRAFAQRPTSLLDNVILAICAFATLVLLESRANQRTTRASRSDVLRGDRSCYFPRLTARPGAPTALSVTLRVAHHASGNVRLRSGPRREFVWRPSSRGPSSRQDRGSEPLGRVVRARRAASRAVAAPTQRNPGHLAGLQVEGAWPMSQLREERERPGRARSWVQRGTLRTGVVNASLTSEGRSKGDLGGLQGDKRVRAELVSLSDSETTRWTSSALGWSSHQSSASYSW